MGSQNVPSRVLKQLTRCLTGPDKAPLSEEALYYSQKCLAEHGPQFPNQHLKYAIDSGTLSNLSRRGAYRDGGIDGLSQTKIQNTPVPVSQSLRQ